MYVQSHFALGDDAIRGVLARAGAFDLVTLGPDGLDATHLPMFYDPAAGERGSLCAHMSKINPQWRDVGGEALAITTLDEHYVSPTWLPSAASGEVAPTWDYITVHCHGQLIVHSDDDDWVRRLLSLLTEQHEAANEAPWHLEQASREWVDRRLPAIAGVELRITRWEAKAKMSQNRSSADIAAEIDRLGDHPAALFKRDVSLPHAVAREEVLAHLGRRRA